MATHDFLDADLSWAFRRGSWVYPHPVAAACGRLLRARSPESLVDATIKGAEVLARYLALVALASYLARDGESDQQVDLAGFEGPLSFGHFLTVARDLARAAIDHPVRSLLAAGLKPKGKGKQQRPGATDEALVQLLELRNALGHEISSLTRANAEALLSRDHPVEVLAHALDGVKGLLMLPLFVLEAQRLVRKKIVARRLLLMGETGDPEPESVSLDQGLEEDGVPYLGVRNGALRLDPLIVWSVAPARANYSLFVLDAVLSGGLRYKAIETDPLEANGKAIARLRDCLQGARVPQEDFTLEGGVSPTSEWRKVMSQREAALKQTATGIDWGLLAEGTLLWFASRIRAVASAKDARHVLVEKLLDGRDTLDRREADQLCLLLGEEAQVRRTLRRPMLDLRARNDPGERWSERIETHANVLESLRAAVDFFSRQLHLGEVDIDGLKATTGSADYIAMREALVNLFIHQDYTDTTAAAQVELQPDRATFFNTGHSLVATEQMIEGGKSQARNPLIARALRLIGFAELAGSGIRAVQSAWRTERRRPPRIDSDRNTNTFSLTLDWRQVENTYDEIWKGRIGVHLTAAQAQILNLAVEVEGLGQEEATSGTALRLEEARGALLYLQLQGLLQLVGDRWTLAEHLRDLMNEPEGLGIEEGSDG